MLLSTAYFPPLSWFALAARSGECFVEACEHYQKQSYRNRCYILSPNGPQMLQVPVVHGADMRITQVKVDYSTPWLVRTQRALDTAYESSAFYEYYRDGLFAVLEQKPETLWDLNLNTLRWCLERCHIGTRLFPTSDFAAPGSVQQDWRYAIHPKKKDCILCECGLEKPYYQVFRDKLGGFTPGLSILDLLFNEGPDSLLWIGRN